MQNFDCILHIAKKQTCNKIALSLLIRKIIIVIKKKSRRHIMLRFTKWTAFVFAWALISCVAQPKIEFDCGDTFDWGTKTPKDSPLKAKVKIYNRGNDTLRIKEVKPGCGCTTAPLDKNNIEPGGFATLSITLQAGGYTGDITKTVFVNSNAAESTKTLYLKANIFRPLVCFPNAYLNFGTMLVNKETTSKIVLNNKSKEKIKITKLDFAPAYMVINIKEGDVIPPNEGITIEAKVKPTIAGPFSCRLSIYTDHPEAETTVISGSGRVEVQAEPAPATETPAQKK